ncbi:transcriptional regulator [Amycolatopsis antarctica]|uniref:Transcriptional regulator n=1 Tax=Amycolatopsis antarctica TaxID=1854586 RepID=A0A263D7D7_9PSEU|nr:helix-turn-helix domain-containing protein [Amycolatopsis antarctica]OZM74291.1 transcriptional regulator [Amycolatopsis antarctica]
MNRDIHADGLRALAHPLRLRILSLLTGAAMSAAEAARELGDSQANISYHLRRLHDAGLLDIVEEVSVRGGQAKRYRHDPDSGGRTCARGPDEQALLATILAAELRRRTDYRLSGAPAAMTDAELWVDERTWQQVLAHARALSLLLHNAAKPPRTRGTRRVSVTVSMFTMDPRR